APTTRVVCSSAPPARSSRTSLDSEVCLAWELDSEPVSTTRKFRRASGARAKPGISSGRTRAEGARDFRLCGELPRLNGFSRAVGQTAYRHETRTALRRTGERIFTRPALGAFLRRSAGPVPTP